MTCAKSLSDYSIRILIIGIRILPKSERSWPFSSNRSKRHQSSCGESLVIRFCQMKTSVNMLFQNTFSLEIQRWRSSVSSILPSLSLSTELNICLSMVTPCRCMTSKQTNLESSNCVIVASTVKIFSSSRSIWSTTTASSKSIWLKTTLGIDMLKRVNRLKLRWKIKRNLKISVSNRNSMKV